MKSKIEVVRLVFFFSLIVATCAGLIMVPRVTLPLMLSYVLFLVIYPVLPALMKLGLSKTLAILVIFFGLGSLSVFPIRIYWISNRVEYPVEGQPIN